MFGLTEHFLHEIDNLPKSITPANELSPVFTKPVYSLRTILNNCSKKLCPHFPFTSSIQLYHKLKIHSRTAIGSHKYLDGYTIRTFYRHKKLSFISVCLHLEKTPSPSPKEKGGVYGV